MMTTTNILLVDDHLMLRKGLRLLIEAEEGLNVIGEANDGQEAIDLVGELKPDVVVMDITMPNLNGINATRQILAESPQTRIVALSCHSGKQYVENMLEAGASGYLLKESAPAELVNAIKAVRAGKAYLSADITEIVLTRLRQGAGAVASPAEAQSHKQQRPSVAATIVHRSQLLEKLEAGSRKRLTLVTAPAGYGKSVLVSDWLARCDTPSAWLTVDKNDNDLRLFLKNLLASIRTLIPGGCPNLCVLVKAANLPPITTLAKSLIDDFSHLPAPCNLVFDDYSLIENKSIHDLFSHLLQSSSCPVHLVVIGRRYPFLPLASLRDNNEINELGVNELRFSIQETTFFLERALGHDIDPEMASTWNENTGGWVTGLQLDVYTLKNADNVDTSAPAESVQKGQESEGLVDWRQHLTTREYEILLLLEQRFRDKEIAEKMSISLETVKTHLRNLYSKLYASGRLDAVVKAKELNILSKS